MCIPAPLATVPVTVASLMDVINDSSSCSRKWDIIQESIHHTGLLFPCT